ncbi:MAG: hypothetical protein ABF289_18290 [Clostridiales bacterium]
MKLRKLLSIFLLLPIFPIIGIPDGDGDGAGDHQGNDDGKNDDDKQDKNNSNTDGESGSTEEEDKIYTKKEFTEQIEKRYARERKKIEKKVREEFENNKKKEEMTENERLKAEKEETEKNANSKIEAANKRLIKAEVKTIAVELNIVDGDGAYQLMNKENIEVDENGNITGVKEALEELIKNKTYLVKSTPGTSQTQTVGDDQQGKGKKTGGFDMNSLIRRAAGR